MIILGELVGFAQNRAGTLTIVFHCGTRICVSTSWTLTVGGVGTGTARRF